MVEVDGKKLRRCSERNASNLPVHPSQNQSGCDVWSKVERVFGEEGHPSTQEWIEWMCRGSARGSWFVQERPTDKGERVSLIG